MKVELRGYVGADLEVTFNSNGSTKCQFSLAENIMKFNRETKKKEQVDVQWHKCIYWAYSDWDVKVLQKWVKKGNKVIIEGEPKKNEWQGEIEEQIIVKELHLDWQAMRPKREER